MDGIRFSPVKYGFVEFVHRKNFSHFTFHSEVATYSIEQTLENITGIIRGQSRQIRTIRDMPRYAVRGISGHRREIVYVSAENADFTCTIVILRQYPAQFTFVFFSTVAFAYESQPYFEQVLRTFDAEPIADHEAFIQKHSPVVFSEGNYFTLLSMLVMEPEKYAGRPVTMTGFLYHEPGFGSRRFLLGRMYTPPGGDEALPYGLMCEVRSMDSLEPGQWYTAEGTLRTMRSGNRTLPLVVVGSIEESLPLD